MTGGCAPDTGRVALLLSAAEVKQLYSFVDGAIMIPDVRANLHRNWGFCPRHTWAHALVECELRGGRPFGMSILYADLTRRAAHAVHGHVAWSTRRARRLRPRRKAECPTCAYVAFARDDPYYAGRRERVNRAERFRARILSCRHVWSDRACPNCDPRGTGIPCRQHFAEDPKAAPATLAADLVALSGRLARFTKTMTWHGPELTDDLESSWVEALGFFGGWGVPLALAARSRLGSA